MKVLTRTRNGETEIDDLTIAEEIENILEERFGEEIFVDHDEVLRFVRSFLEEHNRKERRIRFLEKVLEEENKK